MNQQFKVMLPAWGKAIGLLCMIIIFAAVLWLVWTGNLNIRYTADREEVIPIWHSMLPAFLGIFLIRMIPYKSQNHRCFQQMDKKNLVVQSIVLLLSGVLFTVSLISIDQQGLHFQLYYLAFKLTTLLFIPLILLLIYRKMTARQLDIISAKPRSRGHVIAPMIVIVVWSYLKFYSPIAQPEGAIVSTDMTELLLLVLIGFMINSVLEEVFYRVWLQTRLEALLGRWPAILLVSILWSIWHVAIQGNGQWDIDVATVIANHGVTGLFLGYLWARYRKIWVIILAHGLMNASPHFLLQILFH
ncbi:CPBP family intramembrane glutamic endopeptidase [Paenibacillus sp. FSL R5-0766]|uniref:CPBP family intramembrane glutamic endopeptidase n=1 Tax=unclassified Paenibacillus TaxID=185978 RepID=UPI00096CDB10|nr:CPBP family intramembrane glutamic endopeptidase [Paenibacillus sp. FSL R5-0765]OMF62616.1 CAAX protease family protein [Paenibacillus sp. FSL R5-0765]